MTLTIHRTRVLKIQKTDSVIQLFRPQTSVSTHSGLNSVIDLYPKFKYHTCLMPPLLLYLNLIIILFYPDPAPLFLFDYRNFGARGEKFKRKGT